MNNKERLGSVLDGRMKETSGAAVPTAIELGTINGNLSLTTDSLQSPIPKGEYMIDARLASNSYETSSAAHTHSGGSHSHSGGEHSHQLPEVFRALNAGDRVLVAWCGNEPVVIAIVVSS